MAARKKNLSGNKQRPRPDAAKIGVNADNSRRMSRRRDKTKNQQLQKQFLTEKDFRLRLQEVLFTPEQILQNIFRKDGPPLGVEFDRIASRGFRSSKTDNRKSYRICQEKQRPLKRQKVSTLALEYQAFTERSVPRKKHGIGKELMTKNGPPMEKHGMGKGLMTKYGQSMKKHGMGKGLMTKNGPAMKKQGIGKGLITKRGVPARKHGIGKGLMTVWRLTNPDGGDLPLDIATSTSAYNSLQEKKKPSRRQSLVSKLRKKAQDKRKPSQRNQKAGSQKIEKQNQPRKGKCDLALEVERYGEDLDQYALLIDDEELELRELQAGPNQLTCSHLAPNRLHGCSLCKDLLSKFPPDCVSMKLPLYVQPWDSSPELVKKLFKVFHFIYTYSVILDTCSFTLDELAQAFLDKDSFLLGQLHLNILKLLLSDIEVEINGGYFPRASKNSKFMELLHSVEDKRYLLESWQKALNGMTWTEILRQVLVAAGFGSKVTLSSDAFNKEENIMAKYSLRPGTLKGELFTALLSKGNNGMSVSELSKLSSISGLNLAATAQEVEYVISSTLSSDITLFEKISSTAYRLRVHTSMESESCQSDPEDFGSVDNESETDAGFNTCDESESEHCDFSPMEVKQKKPKEDNKNNMLVVYTEIDESHPGEVWLLGLMEGEYSDLSIDEKLSALLALIDLLNSGSSVGEEDPVAAMSTFASNFSQHGSGAKIKRSMVKQSRMPLQIGCYSGLVLNNGDTCDTSVLNPVDSLAPLTKISKGGKASNTSDVSKDLHFMQSIFLGSDRRYNRYWLFLGPCDGLDPGHRRIYFESSEDGHWGVIDTQEALCSLLSSLDHRGAREAFLLSSLEKRESCLCRVMSNMLNDAELRQLTQSDQSDQNMSREDSSSAVSDVDNNLCLIEMQKSFPSNDIVVFDKGRKAEQRDKWNRAQTFDKWIWESFYSGLHAVKCGKKSFLDSLTRCERCHDLYWRDEKHCKVCHATFELDFDLEEKYAIHAATCRGNMDAERLIKHKVLSSQLQSLKAAIHAIESVMPEEAMSFMWAKSAHNLWVKRLRRTSTLTEFIQVVADFVSAINEDYFYASHGNRESNWVLEEIISSFPTMHQTSSAVALWLVKLDALVAPHL